MRENEFFGRMKALLEVFEDRMSELAEHEASLSEATNTAAELIKEMKKLGTSTVEAKPVEKPIATTWMTKGEVAKWLKVNEKTVSRWEATGIIAGYRAEESSHARFDRDEVEHAIKRQRNSQTVVTSHRFNSATSIDDLYIDWFACQKPKENLVPLIPRRQLEDFDTDELLQVVYEYLKEHKSRFGKVFSDEQIRHITIFCAREIIKDAMSPIKRKIWPIWIPVEEFLFEIPDLINPSDIVAEFRRMDQTSNQDSE